MRQRKQKDNKLHKVKRVNWQREKILRARNHQIAAKETTNNIVVSARDGKVFVLPDGSRYVEFMCCSYLGLDQDERVLNAGREYMEKLGVNIAISRTRVRADQFDVLEKYLNKIFCDSYTTVFSTLHILHAGMFPLIGSGELPNFPIKEQGCSFVMDKFAHASLQLVRGILEQFGDVVVVDFQDSNALENAFFEANKSNKTPVSISDSIISMGGIAPISYLLELAAKHSGYVYLDDAHGTSIIGKHGCGYTLNLLGNRHHPRLILAASLSKGFGTNGAVIVLPKKEDIMMVRTFCGPYIFSNPPPLAIIESSIASAKIHLSSEITTLQKKLWSNVKLLDDLLENYLENYQEESPIRRIYIGDELKTIKCAEALKIQGFLVSPSMFPSVEKGAAILRIVVSAIHTEKQIQDLASHIKNILD